MSVPVRLPKNIVISRRFGMSQQKMWQAGAQTALNGFVTFILRIVCEYDGQLWARFGVDLPPGIGCSINLRENDVP